jgi:hypothetical protein
MLVYEEGIEETDECFLHACILSKSAEKSELITGTIRVLGSNRRNVWSMVVNAHWGFSIWKQLDV